MLQKNSNEVSNPSEQKINKYMRNLFNNKQNFHSTPLISTATEYLC